MKKFALLFFLFCLFHGVDAHAAYSSSSNEAAVFNGIYEAMDRLNIPARDTKGLDRTSRKCRDIFHQVIVIKDGRARIAHNITEILMEIDMLEKNLDASSKEFIVENRALLILARALLKGELSLNLSKLKLDDIKNREMYLFCRIITSLVLLYEGRLAPEEQRLIAYATVDYSNNDSYIDNASKSMVLLIEDECQIAPQKLLKERLDSSGNRLTGSFYGIYYGKNNKAYAKTYYSLFINNGEPTYNYYNFSYMPHAIETFYYNKNGDIIHQPLFVKNVLISKGMFKLELASDPLSNGEKVDSIIKARFLDKDRIELVDSMQDGKSIYVRDVNKYLSEPRNNVKLGASLPFSKVSSAIPAYIADYDKRYISKPYKKVKVGDVSYIIYISFIEAPSSIHKEVVQEGIMLSLWKENAGAKAVTLTSTAYLGSGGYLTDCEVEEASILCRVFDKMKPEEKGDDNIVANYYRLQLKGDRLILTSFSSKAKLNGKKLQQVHFTGEMDASTINSDILKELYKPYF